jgi:hypothetical protein
MHRNAPPSAPQGSRLRGLLTLFGIVAAIVVLLAGWNFITDREPQSFFVQNQKLIDTSGREYAADSMAAYSFNDDGVMVLDLGPGFSLTVKVPFDVPAGSKPAKVEVHDSAFSGGARVNVEAKS